MLTRAVLDDPLAGVRAARLIADVGAGLLREYGLAARAAGRSWDDVAWALGLSDDDTTGDARGDSRGEAAFEWLVEGRAPAVRAEPFRWQATAGWTCADCRARVLDRGPFESHPADREQGHAPGCARHRAAIRAWRREHDPEGHDPEEHDQERDDQQQGRDEQVQGRADEGPGGGRR